MDILNYATYKFVPLADPEQVRFDIYNQALRDGVKGTILVAHEGINVFCAAPVAAARNFMAWLKSDPRFADIEPKESLSAIVPYLKLKVKVRPEIIKMNAPSIVPDDYRAPAVEAATLKRWLDAGVDDAGRPVVMLDTRNRFEIEYGTFKNTTQWDIDVFSQFPEAVATHKDEMAGKTVVSFCTGGIRCEKAALHMQAAGMDNVYQLEGGILKYFEQTGGAHYDGQCFVFDDREAVDGALNPLRNEAKDVNARTRVKGVVPQAN